MMLSGEDTYRCRIRNVKGGLGCGLGASQFMEHSECRSSYMKRDNSFEIKIYRVQFLS